MNPPEPPPHPHPLALRTPKGELLKISPYVGSHNQCSIDRRASGYLARASEIEMQQRAPVSRASGARWSVTVHTHDGRVLHLHACSQCLKYTLDSRLKNMMVAGYFQSWRASQEMYGE
jgi:tRNA A37 N6-isopentenylltransferase MiaA